MCQAQYSCGSRGMRRADSVPIVTFLFEVVGWVVGAWQIPNRIAVGLRLSQYDDFVLAADRDDEFVAGLHFESFAGFLRDYDLVFG